MDVDDLMTMDHTPIIACPFHNKLEATSKQQRPHKYVL